MASDVGKVGVTGWALQVGAHWAPAHLSSADGSIFQWFRLSRNACKSWVSIARMMVRRLTWGLMPESAESYAKAVWSSFGPPVFTGEKDVRPPEG